MIALAVAEGVWACMSHHVYCVGDKTFLQKGGGPIGLELTGVVSRALMWRWDKLFLEKVQGAGIKMILCEGMWTTQIKWQLYCPQGQSMMEKEAKLLLTPIWLIKMCQPMKD